MDFNSQLLKLIIGVKKKLRIKNCFFTHISFMKNHDFAVGVKIISH